MLTGKAIGAALLAITAVALGLRVTGLDRLQPHLQEPDAFLVAQVQILRAGQQDRPQSRPAYKFYPTILARCVAALGEPAVDPDTPPGELLAAHMRAAVGDLMRLRRAVAWISVLLVPLTWLFARRLVGSGPALLAAALVAVSVLHLLFSQQARPHGVHATVALAAVVLAMRLRRRPTWGTYLACSLAFALAVGTLHNGVALLFPIAAAHLFRARTPDRVPWWGGALLAVPAVLVVIAFYPSPPEIVGEGGVLRFGGHELPFEKLDGSGFARLATYLWSYEPALAILSVGGLAALLVPAARRRAALAGTELRGDLLVACAYAVPYALALGVLGLTEDRFLLPLLPFLATLAASLLGLARGRPAVQVGVAVLMLAFPAWVVARYVAVRSAPDTIEQAAAWVQANLDPERDRVVLTPRLPLPLFHSAEALRIGREDYVTRQQAWMRWQIDHLPREEEERFEGGARWNLILSPGNLAKRDANAWLDEVDAGYAILEVSRLTSNRPEIMDLRDRVRERGTALAVIRGEDVSRCSDWPLDYQDIQDYAARILRARAFGPCIEIYRLERP